MYEASFYKNIKKYHSPSNSSLVIALSDDEFECSSTAESVDFEMPVRFAALKQEAAPVTVQVISRGQIQFSKTLDQSLAAGTSLHIDDSIFLEPVKEPVTKDLIRGHFTVSITLPKTVSPKAKVIVWYARDDGEVVSDARELSITACLLNNVNVTWSTVKAQPGDQASVSIAAAPLSLCSLGVVDKSVELLSAKKNALTIKTLLELADKASVTEHENLQVDDHIYCKGKYEDDKKDVIIPILPPVALPLTRRAKRSAEEDKSSVDAVAERAKRSFIHPYPFYSDDVDALHMFDEAGVYVLSDLKLETRPCRRRYGIDIPMLRLPRPVFLAAPPPPMYLEVDDNRKSTKYESDGAEENIEPSKTRTYFPETWLWDLFGIASVTYCQ